VLVVAEAISNQWERRRFAAMSFKMYSAMGLRQMLPWQMKCSFCILVSLFQYCAINIHKSISYYKSERWLSIMVVPSNYYDKLFY
jgi:hypothetical protein